MENDETETINKYVKSLIQLKAHPSQIPKKLIPKINVQLDISKSEAIQKGSIDKVMRIQRIKSGLINAEQRRRAFSSHSILPPLSTHKSSTISHPREELEAILDDMAEGIPLNHNDSSLVPELIPFAKEKINKLVKERKFTIAQTYENALRQLIIIDQDIQTENKHSSQKDNIEKKLQAATESLEQAKSDFQKSIVEFEQKAEESKNKIIEKQKQQLLAFDEETQQGPSSKVIKYSHQYHTMRNKQALLISAKAYEEAAFLKEQADKLKEVEAEEQKQRFYIDRQILRNQMIKNFEVEMDCYEEQINQKRFNLQMNGEMILRNKQKNVENITIDFEEAKSRVKNDELRAKTIKTTTKSQRLTALQKERECRSKNVSVSTQTIKRYIFPILSQKAQNSQLG